MDSGQQCLGERLMRIFGRQGSHTLIKPGSLALLFPRFNPKSKIRTSNLNQALK